MQDCSLNLGKANLVQKNCKKGPQSSEMFKNFNGFRLSFGQIRTSQNPRGNTAHVTRILHLILFYCLHKLDCYPQVTQIRIESKRSEPKLRRESNPKLVQRFPVYAALYPLSYREVMAILRKMALKNPQHHLRQNRPKSYQHFAVDGKIDST